MLPTEVQRYRGILHESIQPCSGYYYISWLQFPKKLGFLSVDSTTHRSTFQSQVHAASFIVSSRDCSLKKQRPANSNDKDNSLCFNCLGCHKVTQCLSKFRCRRYEKSITQVSAIVSQPAFQQAPVVIRRQVVIRRKVTSRIQDPLHI